MWIFSFYRKNSDIFMPYGPPAEEYRRRLSMEGNLLKSLPKIISGKTKLVAWMVSNCRKDSGRNDYVKELQKFINIDVYGKCGPLKCDNNDSNTCCKLHN